MRFRSSGLVSYTFEGRPSTRVWLTLCFVIAVNIVALFGWAYCAYKTITDTNFWWVLGTVIGTLIFLGRSE